jgi:phosphoribosylglycinamide formyltransferase-1
MKHIAILASGSGTNAENIIKYFKNRDGFRIVLLMSNRKDAYALTRAENHNVPARVFDRDDLYSSGNVLKTLEEFSVDLVILAGFLWLIPDDIIRAFPKRILNIHPALLPSYGGKGMYGSRVHEAVIANREKRSGITIHIVNEEYDAGNIIFQADCPVMESDTPESLAKRIHELEYRHYPEVIRDYAAGL